MSDGTTVFESIVREMLLQQHRALLRSTDTCRAIGRSLSAAATLAVLLISSSTTITARRSFLVLAPTLLIALFWFLEQEWIRSRLRQIEFTLSRSSPGYLEDAYIRSRYVDLRFGRVADLYLRAEPIAWGVLAYGVLAFLQKPGA